MEYGNAAECSLALAQEVRRGRRLAISSAEFGRRRAHAGHAARRNRGILATGERLKSVEIRVASAVLEHAHHLFDRYGAAADPYMTVGAAAAVDRARQRQSIDVVWTGPDAGSGTGRLTAAVVVGLIGEATKEILLVSYAAHSEPAVEQALTDAVARGVEVTLVLERAADNPTYTFTGPVFAGLHARRLHWPSSQRPTGASLHAKVIVVDRETALVGSANLTSWAMERNLECGILISGGDQPRAIHRHIDLLIQTGVPSPA